MQKHVVSEMISIVLERAETWNDLMHIMFGIHRLLKNKSAHTNS